MTGTLLSLLSLLSSLLMTGCQAGPEPVEVTHGPLVAWVGQDQASVMVRVADAAEVGLECTPEQGAGSLVLPAEPAVAEADFTAHFALTGLDSGTSYTCVATVDGQASAASTRFSTAPPAEDQVDLRVGILADATKDDGIDTPAYASLAALEPDFVLQIGDLDHSNPGALSPANISRWRQMHRGQLGDALAGQQLAESLLPSCPFVHVWDDHDYGGDDTDGTAQWKDIATQAFREYYPVPDSGLGGIWFSLRWGQTELFMLDSRSQRDPDNSDEADKTMLGQAQLSWLLDGLINSTATWRIVVSPSVFNPSSKNLDSWNNFRSERELIVQTLMEQDITGVLVISGDLHSGGGIDDGTQALLPELSVPTTNIERREDCTGGICGDWSEGMMDGNHPGFALVDIQHDPVSGEDTATLQTYGATGDLRLSWQTPPPPPPTRASPTAAD